MRIAIIGAGLSGLSCAYRLEQQGFNGTLDIFEEKDAVGDANVFLEFVSELFHRPINDFFAYLETHYQLYLQPHRIITRSYNFGPTRSSRYDGFTGYIVVRGSHENSLERQFARQIQSPIYCGKRVYADDIKNEYDYVIVASGRLQDVPKEVGVRVDRYVNFKHGLLKGEYDVHATKMWFNHTYANKGYSFLLPLTEKSAMVCIASSDQEFDMQQGWQRFISEVFGDGCEFQSIHEVRNFAVGQPNRYSYQNQLFVGNVAGGVQPAMGFGLHVAILSGIYAAESILKNKDYASIMQQQNKEYNWSLALRNTIESLNNDHYDMLVDNMNTFIGRWITRQGGININRYAGKILSLLTNEKKMSIFDEEMKPFIGRTLESNNDSHQQDLI